MERFLLGKKITKEKTLKLLEQEDEWNGLPISTPPYTICAKCNHNKCVPINYKSKKGFHHIYKEK